MNRYPKSIERGLIRRPSLPNSDWCAVVVPRYKPTDRHQTDNDHRDISLMQRSEMLLQGCQHQFGKDGEDLRAKLHSKWGGGGISFTR